MSRQVDHQGPRQVPVAKGQLPLFPLEDGNAWWTKRPQVTVNEPTENAEVENPWRGEGSGQSGAPVPGTETAH